MPFSDLRATRIHYDESTIQNMINMVKAAPFPDRAPLDANTPWSLGIPHDYLKMLKETMETKWKWEDIEAKIGKYENHLVHYKSDDGVDELDLHFMHEKSSRPDAIPLILMHGWPGSFFDFNKVIDPLTNPPNADSPAFHVVIPSIPGFFQSTLPRRDGWTLKDIAKVYHGLMTEVLDYKKYAGQGGDWGLLILRIMSNLYSDSLIASHFNAFWTPEDPKDVRVSTVEKRLLERSKDFRATGSGYFEIQRTKPFTIGYAVGSSPLAVLAYIGEKIYLWSDPEKIDPLDIINTVALYHLSGSFATSVVIYNQAGHPDAGDYGLLSIQSLKVKSTFGVSLFPFEIGSSPKSAVQRYGPLEFFKEHDNGGHFPALDSPKAFVDDMREFFGKAFK